MLASDVDFRFDVIHSGVALNSSISEHIVHKLLSKADSATFLAPIVREDGEQTLTLTVREGGKLRSTEIMQCMYSGLIDEDSLQF